MNPRATKSAPLLVALSLAAVAGTIGCKGNDKALTEKVGTPPPPPAIATQPGACQNGGGTVNDPVSAGFFPRTVAAYCVDPQGETKSYGDKAKFTMDEVCTTAFDGECEVYKRFGLKRTVALRYVDGGGGAGSVDIYLSEFKNVDGGYGMFTKRVIADGDPADPMAPRVLEAGGAGAIGTGRAYVWKGPYVVELQYNNEQESPEQLAKSSEPLLSALGKAIGEKLPGSGDKPAAAAALPGAHLIPGGISYLVKEPFGIANLSPAAVGFYKDGDARYRLVAIAPPDAEHAKGEMKTLRGRPGALPVASVAGADEAVHFAVGASGGDAPYGGGAAGKTEYVFARKGAMLAGVGDDEGQGGQAKRLTKDEKVAALKGWLSAAPAAVPAKAAK